MLCACVSTNAAVMNTSLIRPAIHPDSVVIYRTADQVPRKYDEIALLNSKGDVDMTDEAKMFKSMRKKAAELGANGVILGEMKDPGTGAKVAKVLIGTSANRKGKSVAIYVYPQGKDSVTTSR
jgi:hypothetical protein